ncbi:hypothetical protein P152DRAFT_457795 [Eremomyces bilateralis CBS 781.70]|uniref:TPR-like protein n=1 Tax=Eremomyces bilateralis CBS 781.70 TaxID=1392243 RepID=A0A6G1G655_9PEZI|nr:uncharacterized protein P152DRAFT_457795 [Eremomyces bilateralis CBS 781.70]KAF1813431.1 hypothetical protein P152DRAFT_457795 [Eremomyces bilateralis CBS 781.70]
MGKHFDWPWKKGKRPVSPPPTGQNGHGGPSAPTSSKQAEKSDTTSAKSPSPLTQGEIFGAQGDKLSNECNYNDAIAMYTAALGSMPTNTHLLISRCIAYQLSQPPRIDRAMLDANTAIRVDSSCWQGWYQRGELLQDAGYSSSAIESLRRAEQLAGGTDKLTVRRAIAQASAQDKAAQAAPTTGFAVPLSPHPTGSPAASPTQSTDFPVGNASTSSQAEKPHAPSQPPTTPSEHPLQQTVPQVSASTLPVQPPIHPSPQPMASQSQSPTPQSQPSTGSAMPFRSATVHGPPSSTPGQVSSSTGSQNAPPAASGSSAAPGTTSISRAYNTTSVSETPASSIPITSDDFIDMSDMTPSDPPPAYAPSPGYQAWTSAPLSPQTLSARLAQLQTAMTTRNRGGLSLRPFTSAVDIDAVCLLYIGLTESELTARELPIPIYIHPSFRLSAVDMLKYPANTFLDMDCTSVSNYDGKLPGTVTVSGWSEEYRAHQLIAKPVVQLSVEGRRTIPELPIDQVVERMRKLQVFRTLEDNEGLVKLLGMSQLEALQAGLVGGTRQKQIEVLCMAVSRSVTDCPTRFVDFSKDRMFSVHTLGTAAQGSRGLGNFLFQIVLGFEILIRLRKESLSTKYAMVVTDNISAMTVLAELWMDNVTVSGPNQNTSATTTTTTTTAATTTTTAPPRYTLCTHSYNTRVQGLIQFAETISWPYMDEVRQYIETAYLHLSSGTGTVSFDICDWLFGLILPGKIFQHRIMCCLVYASPTIRSIGPAPFYENGIIVGNKSYWPKRTVLGRILGGLKNSRSMGGWIGPVPKPIGNLSGWVRLRARPVDVPIPVSAPPGQSALHHLGVDQPATNEELERSIQEIMDENEWIKPDPPTKPSNDTRKSVFKGIRLELLPIVSNTPYLLTPAHPKEEYRAMLDFEVNGVATTFTLYSIPVFVAAPPCIGVHVLHRRRVQNQLQNILKVSELKDESPLSSELVIIDALGDGEEVVARAWCAEKGRHAVVRRGNDCCFSCAVTVASQRTGLNINVIIWSQ